MRDLPWIGCAISVEYAEVRQGFQNFVHQGIVLNEIEVFPYSWSSQRLCIEAFIHDFIFEANQIMTKRPQLLLRPKTTLCIERMKAKKYLHQPLDAS